MARGINKVILVGNLGADPETRYTKGGAPVTNLRIATSESWRDKESGQVEERTEWHRVTTFGRLAEISGEYLRKGSKVYLEGQLQTRKWTDQSGQERYTTEIVLQQFRGELTMLDARGEGGGGGGGGGGDPDMGGGGGGRSTGGRGAPKGGDLDDEIPF